MVDCAKCGRHFFQHSPVNAFWCDRDRTFVCRSCAVRTGKGIPRKCPLCSGRVSTALTVGFWAGVGAVAICLVLGTAFYVTFQYEAYLQSTPVVPLSGVQAGEHVRVFGQIWSPSSPVLSAHWVAGVKGGGHWSWSGHDFDLMSGNASVPIHLGGMLQNMYGEPPHVTSTTEAYDAGDWIAIVGTAVANGNGSAIEAEASSNSLDGFATPGIGILADASYIGAAVAGGWVAYTYVRAFQRARAHAQRLRQPGMYDYRPPAAEQTQP